MNNLASDSDTHPQKERFMDSWKMARFHYEMQTQTATSET